MRPYPNFVEVGWGSGRAYYFENAYEFLDEPGEWYLDYDREHVYYKPRSGEDITSATVVAPMVETVVAVQGHEHSNQARYLWFQGLTFAHRRTWGRANRATSTRRRANPTHGGIQQQPDRGPSAGRSHA